MSDDDLFNVDVDPFEAPARPVGLRPAEVEESDEEAVPPTCFGSADE